MKKSSEIYNSTLEYLKTVEKLPPKYALRNTMKDKFKDEIKKTHLPNTVTEYAIFEALLAKK
jgi:hypothetical protein